MISTQRIIALVMGINLILAFIFAFYYSAYETTNTDNLPCGLGDTVDQFTTIDTLPNSQNTDDQNELTAGDSMTASGLLWDTLACGIIPLPFKSEQFDTDFEKDAIFMINLLRILLSSFVALEIYLLIKNKKAT